MARQPFSALVATEAWHDDAVGWTREVLAARGIAVTGEIEQPRIRPWSTQLTVPTDHGLVWFKACCPSMAFEPALQQAMADLLPGSVADPLAIETARGWMLTPDRGPTIGDQRSPTLDDWRRALVAAARAQRVLATHRDRLLATGLPDCGPETVVDRFDRLLALQEELPEDHHVRVAEADIEQLRARRPELVDACAVLVESPLPATWNHGDLHPWNLFGTDDRVAFFDLGDGTWSSAVEILSVPYGSITDRGEIAWTDVLPAWQEVWQVDDATLAEAWRASGFTHAVNRAVTWYHALQSASLEETVEWGHAVRVHLTSMLDV